MPGSNSIQPVSFDLYPPDAPRRKQYRLVWVDVAAAAGNQDRNLFIDGSTLLEDVAIHIEVTAIGLKDDGSEGYSGKKIITARKDGSADAVAVGAVTTVNEHRDDAGATITLSVEAGNFIRVAYTTGGADSYRWTIFATITQTVLNS